MGHIKLAQPSLSSLHPASLRTGKLLEDRKRGSRLLIMDSQKQQRLVSNKRVDNNTNPKL